MDEGTARGYDWCGGAGRGKGRDGRCGLRDIRNTSRRKGGGSKGEERRERRARCFAAS